MYRLIASSWSHVSVAVCFNQLFSQGALWLAIAIKFKGAHRQHVSLSVMPVILCNIVALHRSHLWHISCSPYAVCSTMFQLGQWNQLNTLSLAAVLLYVVNPIFIHVATDCGKMLFAKVVTCFGLPAWYRYIFCGDGMYESIRRLPVRCHVTLGNVNPGVVHGWITFLQREVALEDCNEDMSSIGRAEHAGYYSWMSRDVISPIYLQRKGQKRVCAHYAEKLWPLSQVVALPSCR